MEVFERKCEDNMSTVSRAATWGTCRPSSSGISKNDETTGSNLSEVSAGYWAEMLVPVRTGLECKENQTQADSVAPWDMLQRIMFASE